MSTTTPAKPKPKTLAVIESFAANPEAIVQPGELVDLRFPAGSKLTLRGGKLFVLLVKAAGPRIVEPIQHRLSLASLNASFHVSVPELTDLIDELHGSIVKLHLRDAEGRPYTKSGPILSDFEREEPNAPQAEIRFEFSPTLRRAVANSVHWAVLSRRAILAFGSKYSLRLYTVLSLRAKLRKATEQVSLDDLRELLGVPAGKLPRWRDLQTRVLDPAVNEVCHLSGLVVGYVPVKQGRKVVAITLVWSAKDESGRVEALRELDRPKVGRKARRDGLVEELAETEDRARAAMVEELASLPPMRLT